MRIIILRTPAGSERNHHREPEDLIWVIYLAVIGGIRDLVREQSKDCPTEGSKYGSVRPSSLVLS